LTNPSLQLDIFDEELSLLRKARWNKAFTKSGHDLVDSERVTVNRKATIVIEYLIQASDVSHTMQHWQVYTKWNHNLFEEMFMAYFAGKIEKDPSAGWYEGELLFFDNYVIPLARKLKECKAFGVSSDEYLNYAERNRKEWELKGEGIVQVMHDEIIKKARSRFKRSDPILTDNIER